MSDDLARENAELRQRLADVEKEAAISRRAFDDVRKKHVALLTKVEEFRTQLPIWEKEIPESKDKYIKLMGFHRLALKFKELFGGE